MRRLLKLLGLLIIVLFFFSCDTGNGSVTTINKEQFTLQDQRDIGMVLAEALRTDYVHFPRLSRTGFPNAYSYLDQLLLTLLNSPRIDNRSTFDWTISIIRDDTDQLAFALPGGHLYVSTGLLKVLQGEDQLVSVLAHLIAFVDDDFLVQRLRTEFGGVAMGDILLRKTPNDAQTMNLHLRNLRYEESEVYDADDFVIDVVCPYAYNVYGLSDLLEYVRTSALDVTWLNQQRADPSLRIERLEDRAVAQACGTEGDTFTTRYQDFLEHYLP